MLQGGEFLRVDPAILLAFGGQQAASGNVWMAMHSLVNAGMATCT